VVFFNPFYRCFLFIVGYNMQFTHCRSEWFSLCLINYLLITLKCKVLFKSLVAYKYWLTECICVIWYTLPYIVYSFVIISAVTCQTSDTVFSICNDIMHLSYGSLELKKYKNINQYIVNNTELMVKSFTGRQSCFLLQYMYIVHVYRLTFVGILIHNSIDQ